MASIEFGILEDWSTVSLRPAYRVEMSEDVFASILPILDRIRKRTGIEFDLYSGNEIVGKSLDVFIEEMSCCVEEACSEVKVIIGQLLRSAEQARILQQPLQYRGL